MEPVIEAVRVTDSPDEYAPNGVTVTPVWTGVDRPASFGWLCKDAAIADRLKRAIEAGVVFGPPRVETDVNGRTFVTASANVLGRRMNADLRRLGF